MADRPLQGLSDKDLIRRCCKMDRVAWDEFAERFNPTMVNVVRRSILRLRGRPDKELEQDLFQEIWLEIVSDGAKALRRFLGRATLEAFIATIARWVCYDLLVKKGRALRTNEAVLIESLRAEVPEQIDALLEEETLPRLRSALEALPPLDRLIVVLSSVNGMPQSQIAKSLGLTHEAVRLRASRTRKRLRELLQ